jgi:hypothetical protein
MQFFRGDKTLTIVGNRDKINIFRQLFQLYSPEFFSGLREKLTEGDLGFKMLLLSLDDEPLSNSTWSSSTFHYNESDTKAGILIISSFTMEVIQIFMDFLSEAGPNLCKFLTKDVCWEFMEMYPPSVEVEVIDTCVTRINILKTSTLSHFVTSGEMGEDSFQEVDPDDYSACSNRAERFGVCVNSYQNIYEGSVLINKPLNNQDRDVDDNDGDSKKKSVGELLQIEDEFENYLQQGQLLRARGIII